MSVENKFVFNFVLLGELGVGKTTFMMTFAEQKPHKESKATIVHDV